MLARIEQAQQAEQSDRDALCAQLARDLTTEATTEAAAEGAAERATDVSAEAPDPLSAPAPAPAPSYAEPYEYVEPPYPMPRQRVGLFEQRSATEVAAIAAWQLECERRRGLRDAGRAWQEHLEREAPARQIPLAQASRVDGLLRALLRPEKRKPSTVQVLIDPVSGWARTRQGELLPRAP